MIGRKLAHFEITAELGKGGMGEVYRAVDSRLGRDVAIKVLPEVFTSDPERLARFEREARVLASLNHPNIAGIHQVEEAEGLRLLVMELVEGEDLSAILRRGPLSLEDTLKVGLQVAEALESAHESGVVHRDLKPANIKVTPDGRAKVLDFGLAKALAGPGEGGDPSAMSLSPTLTAMTGAGVLLGTAAYMSPEQAKGLEPDRRTDVWAFGVVLWEMLTGRRLFVGDSVSDTLAAVLRDEIDGDALPAEIPSGLRALLARCLDRDPKTRLRDIGEARVALRALSGGSEGSTLLGTRPLATDRDASPSSRLPWILVAALAVLASLAGYLALRPQTDAGPLVYSEFMAPEGTDLNVSYGLAFSPDGRHLAFTALGADSQRLLWVRSLETGEVRVLPGTEGATYPFWSPDSRQLGFMGRGSLQRIAASGGSPRDLAPVREGRGGAWGPDGRIVYAQDYRGELWSVLATGGTPAPLTQLDPERGEQAHRFPIFLPGGKKLLFLDQTAEGGTRDDRSRIEMLDLATGTRTAVLEANSSMAYSPSGHLLFWREGSLVAVEFDAASGRVGSDTVPLADEIGYTGNEFATFSISDTGLLVYQTGGLSDITTRLVPFDWDGVLFGNPSEPDVHQDLSLSHDGRRAVYRGRDNQTIWVLDLDRGTRSRFTFEDGDHFSPLWSPDDQWIVYGASGGGSFRLYRKAASGLGAAELLFEAPWDLEATDWSPDGRYLAVNVFDDQSDTDQDVALFDLEERELEILIQSPFFDAHAAFSPDGRWIAYASSDSGQFEVFVVPISGGGGRFQISTAGGHHPRWDPSGTRLYYIDPRVDLMAVDVDFEGGVTIGLPQRLFEIRHPYNSVRPFQVLPDGTGFLTTQLEQEVRGAELTLVQNWLRLLESR